MTLLNILLNLSLLIGGKGVISKELLFQNAVEAFTDGNKSKAAKLFYEFYVKYPRDWRTPYAMYYYILAAPATDAAKMARKLLVRYPNFKYRDKVYFQTGLTLYLAGYLDAAKKWFKALLKNPLNKSSEELHRANFYLGKIYEAEEYDRKAISYFLKVRKPEDIYYASRVEICYLLDKLNHTVKAIEILVKLIEHYPYAKYEPKALLLLGDLYSKVGRSDLAYKMYKFLVNRYPLSAEASAARAKLY